MAYAKPLGFRARGETLWAHRDAAGRILEIELLGFSLGERRDVTVSYDHPKPSTLHLWLLV
jgi:hypothetical protein